MKTLKALSLSALLLSSASASALMGTEVPSFDWNEFSTAPSYIEYMVSHNEDGSIRDFVNGEQQTRLFKCYTGTVNQTYDNLQLWDIPSTPHDGLDDTGTVCYSYDGTLAYGSDELEDSFRTIYSSFTGRWWSDYVINNLDSRIIGTIDADSDFHRNLSYDSNAVNELNILAQNITQIKSDKAFAEQDWVEKAIAERERETALRESAKLSAEVTFQGRKLKGTLGLGVYEAVVFNQASNQSLSLSIAPKELKSTLIVTVVWTDTVSINNVNKMFDNVLTNVDCGKNRVIDNSTDCTFEVADYSEYYTSMKPNVANISVSGSGLVGVLIETKPLTL